MDKVLKKFYLPSHTIHQIRKHQFEVNRSFQFIGAKERAKGALDVLAMIEMIPEHITVKTSG